MIISAGDGAKSHGLLFIEPRTTQYFHMHAVLGVRGFALMESLLPSDIFAFARRQFFQVFFNTRFVFQLPTFDLP